MDFCYPIIYIRNVKVSDLTFDPDNANKGTPRGEGALDRSISQLGVGRSILVDKNGVIIAGNKTAQKAAELGIDHVEVVQTTGNTVVAVQRTDLDLQTDEQARQLAYADNRVSELSLDFDAEQMLQDVEKGVDLAQFWTEQELEEIFERAVDQGEADDGPFSSFNPDSDETIAFKFGDYSGRVSADLYRMFKDKYESMRDDSGEVMIDGVLRQWLKLDCVSA